ncbi:MAG: efflux RND transporter periplasmic adaptor subunit [Candidatus Krumholzibacteria bacterium]|nr:efflux RND transporter periplasmic adaptor subunit [Candidatus Krumholzibacteria bacterium]MDH4336156.1 efflux RND transporter periplasmic adaptor subunit [Candidatus Krumholzibacteria bacterium]MDH5268797.1 efflux RND transporter periplasmic adaptor subunit [Candidatus Krumholzibacteria bacterium]
MRRKPLWIGAAAVVVLGGVAGIMAFRDGGDKALTVQTARVERQKIVQKVNGTGTIQPRTQVKISADVSGKITRLVVVEGQWVEKGTLLLELDRTRFLAAVESAEANVSSAEASAVLVRENMLRAEKEYNRSRELLEKGMESQANFDVLDAAYKVETARYKSTQDQAEQARAALKQARDDLSKTTIYAPMAGTISDLNKEQGEIAIGSQFQPDVILVIADLSEMEAQVNVDENDIVSIQIGQEAEIEVDALLDQTLTGTVTEIANSANVGGAGSADQKTEFEIKITIKNPPETLRPGMTASADIFTKTNENAVSVPIQSVAVRTVDQLAAAGEERKDAEARFTADRDGFVEIVFCIEDSKAVARQVKTGIQSDELIEILDGLEEGEEVVTGSYRAISKDLVNGAVVTVENEEKDAGGEHARGSGE